MAENSDHRAIQVQNQAGSVLRPVNELSLEPVIDAVKLVPEIRWRPAEKSPQGLRVRIVR